MTVQISGAKAITKLHPKIREMGSNGTLIVDEAPRAPLQLHKQHDVCLVLDYGSQYTQLIARRVREQSVYSLLLPGDVSLVIACITQMMHVPTAVLKQVDGGIWCTLVQSMCTLVL